MGSLQRSFSRASVLLDRRGRLPRSAQQPVDGADPSAGNRGERLRLASGINFDADHERRTGPTGQDIAVTGRSLAEDGKVPRRC